MSGLYIMDMATVMVGDADPDTLNHLVLQSVQLPSLSEKTSDHTPGGSVMGVNIGMSMLEPRPRPMPTAAAITTIHHRRASAFR